MSHQRAREPLFVIPVRGGSKGILGKNLQKVGGISLVGRAVRTALEARDILGCGRVIVDSDSEELLAEGRRWGAETPFVRPAELAEDASKTLDVLCHLLRRLGIDKAPVSVVLLQATSPLTTVEHVVSAVETHWRSASPVVSVRRGRHPLAWSMRVASNKMTPFFENDGASRRQELPVHYDVTGAVYVAASEELLAGKSFVQAGRTEALEAIDHEPVDIDELDDLVLAEALVQRQPSREITVGAHRIGSESRCFVIVSLSGPFPNGEAASRALRVLTECGADAVQCRAGDAELLKLALGMAPETTRHVELILGLEAGEREFTRNASGAAGLHLGSADTLNDSWLRDLGALRLPVFFAPETDDLAAIEAALRRLRRFGCRDIVLLATVSDEGTTQTPGSKAGVLPRLHNAFKLPVGLCDRSRSPAATLAGLGLGATVLLVALSLEELSLDELADGTAQALRASELQERIRLLREGESHCHRTTG